MQPTHEYASRFPDRKKPRRDGEVEWSTVTIAAPAASGSAINSGHYLRSR
jgi:hypothetical protein